MEAASWNRRKSLQKVPGADKKIPGSAESPGIGIGNIIIFLPFGFFTSYYLNTKKWVSPVLITLIVSLGAEGIQYYIGRIFDVDDIILNVLGGFLGYLLFVAFSAVRGKLPKFMRSDGFLNFIVILIVVIIVLFSVGINIFSYL